MFSRSIRIKKMSQVNFSRIIDKLIRMTQYAIVGGSMLILNVVILYLLTTILGIYYIISAIVSSLFLTGLSFYFNENWTFNSIPKYTYKKQWQRIVSYYLVSSSGIILNIIILFLLTEYGNVYYLYSSIIASFLVFLWRFHLNEKFTWCGT